MGIGEFAGVHGEGWNGWDSNYGIDEIVRMGWIWCEGWVAQIGS